ncbi:MAG: hypothetical protein Q8J74_10795 [Candidatus Didemnitutus sp.]|nr:hypothetical protein [Candidatus Didemnitutus sp.]
MTHFPHRHRRSDSSSAGPPTPAKGSTRDVQWGRPVFRAPILNPKVPVEPLTFGTARLPGRARKHSATKG